MWNNNQRTKISYLVSVKRRLLPKKHFVSCNCTNTWKWLRKTAETCSSIYIHMHMDPLAQTEPLVSYKNKVPVPSTSQPKNLRIYYLHEGQYFQQTTRRQNTHNQTVTVVQILCVAMDYNERSECVANFRHDEHHGLQVSCNLRTQINTHGRPTTDLFHYLQVWGTRVVVNTTLCRYISCWSNK